jgi:hypothetical protein
VLQEVFEEAVVGNWVRKALTVGQSFGKMATGVECTHSCPNEVRLVTEGVCHLQLARDLEVRMMDGKHVSQYL